MNTFSLRILSSMPSGYLETMARDTLGNDPRITGFRFIGDSPVFAECPVVILPHDDDRARDRECLRTYALRLSRNEILRLQERHADDADGGCLTVYASANLVLRSPFPGGIPAYPTDAETLVRHIGTFGNRAFEYAVAFSLLNPCSPRIPGAAMTQTVVGRDPSDNRLPIPEDLLHAFVDVTALTHVDPLEMFKQINLYRALSVCLMHFTDPVSNASRLN